MEIKDKLNTLIGILKQMDKIIIAFSGGVDSSFLLKASKEALGNNILAITMNSPAYHQKDMLEAGDLAESLGIEHIILDHDVFSIEGFKQNDIDRCYHCKIDIFNKIKEIASKRGITNIIEGSNIDDTKDHRPGMKAVKEFDIRSPLIEAGLNKSEIRQLLKKYNMKQSDKPSQACLASRIPYGQIITPERLSRIAKAEEFLIKLGIKTIRVRDYNTLARIETSMEEFHIILCKENREIIINYLKDLGYKHITLDLEGFVSGSMNTFLKA